MISHETSFSAPAEFNGNVDLAFKAEMKYAGWIQGEHGRSNPVVRPAIGRVAEGYTQDAQGRHALQVSEYFALKPHDQPLGLIPGEIVSGFTGQEIKVSFTIPVQEANKINFSHSDIPAAKVIFVGKISARAA